MEFYRIGDTDLVWPAENIPFLPDERMDIFRTDGVGADALIFQSEFCDLYSMRRGQLVYSGLEYDMYRSGDDTFLLYHWMNGRYGMGVRLEELERGNTVPCFLDTSVADGFAVRAGQFFARAGLHAKLLQRGGLVLHASYIVRQGQAVLFAAPSGTGKSTQAELWRRYAGAEIVNGDRVLLRRREGVWFAHGYPCAGSSDICLNRSVPLRAVILLEQSGENSVEMPTEAQKLRALLAGTEVYRWDMREIDRALELARQLVRDCAIVRLKCRPDRDAVSVLQEHLENDL